MKAKKNLGQSFLTDQYFIDLIVNEVAKSKMDLIIEIGPGRGALTRPLFKLNRSFFAIEKDIDLKSDLSFLPDDALFFEDVLDFDFDKLIKNKDCIVVSNLPYNISVPVFLKLLQLENVKEVLLMFQKEVAMKIVDEKKSNSLQVLAHNFMDLEIVANLKKTSFRPIPKVDSMIIKGTRKKATIDINDFKRLEFFLRKLFLHKRKQLKNVIGIDSKLRAEDLSFNEIKDLFGKYYGN